ncbi:sigma-54-dependent Fis family transcriptional regulator [Paludibacterium yongneupense]|uniref:sigma-54-dependent Fis family transcriptional regulator n=1 Tax=Paludibacterium yongneupense TaxID=400061 RepID=UPI00040CAE5E|nr:sigma-54-dependent Fis family transcriptional regulator [Paludibacterium yongneupense]
MTGNSLTGRAILRRARELLLEGSELPLGYMVNTLLASSWRRSAEAGLTPEGRLPDCARLDARQLARASERTEKFICQARPVMEYLQAQIRGSGSMVVLADDCGVILQTYGDAEFLTRADRVALVPGVSWNERHRGTNGIGTSLAEGRPLLVHGGEHFLERNGFLSCAAAPVMAPDGKRLGVINISGDERRHHSHTLGLVRTAAQTLENRLFDACYGHTLHIRFHQLAEGIGTFAEGCAALSEDGWIIGANQPGFALLGISAADLGVTPLSRLLRVNIDDLIDWGYRQPGVPMLLSRSDGSRLFVLLELGRARALSCPVPDTSPRQRDPLAAIDCGDDKLAAVVDKARKLIGKPIAILLQGESGVGKEFFARALHASGPRHAAPFVAVNCAAIPENLLEAELFGHVPTLCRDEWQGRLREANGGTLYIEEIGDLPLPLQARLLDVLRKKHLIPLGGDAIAIDIVLICATQRDLKAEVGAGRFNADLYYHINGMTLRCPPLRERSDFAPLLAHLLEELAPGRMISLEPALTSAFATYSWPGNLNQLTNALRAACTLLEPGETRIGWQHLPDDLAEELRWQSSAPSDTTDAPENLRELSATTMARAIAQSHGNMSEAARRLGISRNTLYRHMRAASSGT